jgi:chitodextrinase
VKENANHNRIENSDCGFNDEPLTWKGSNIELRGDHNLVLNTTVAQSRSWNVKLASDAPAYDLGGNSLQKSKFSGAAAPAIRDDQSTVGSSFCANTFASSPISEGSANVGDPTAPCPDTTAPTAPAGLTAKAASPTSVTLTWTAAADDVGVTVYGVLRNGVQVAAATTTSYTDSGLTASTAYSYTVIARDAAGNTSPASAAASVTTPPPAPTAVTATATSPTAVALTWTAPAGVPVASYGVLRNGTQVGTPTTTSYTDSGLTASTAYTYTVVARDAAGNTSPPSAAVKVTTPAPPPTAQVINAEAESGVLTAPMAVRTATAAQGGRYVSQTTGTTVGKDTLTVNVAVAGKYAPALRVISPNTMSDSFSVTVDGGVATVWNLGTHPAWAWVTGPTLTLTAGPHKIVVSKRENGAQLDAIRLTPVP